LSGPGRGARSGLAGVDVVTGAVEMSEGDTLRTLDGFGPLVLCGFELLVGVALLAVTEKTSPLCIWGSAKADPAIRARRMAKETRTILKNV
jgi:hypothetical protein